MNCATCKHWRRFTNWWDPQRREAAYTPDVDEFLIGECKLARWSIRPGHEPAGMWTSGPKESLVTRDRFGCLEHEPRESA